MIDQVQLVAPQILDRGRVGRAPKKGGELPHDADVVALRLVRELAHPHVVDHALTQRRDPVKSMSPWLFRQDLIQRPLAAAPPPGWP